MAAKTIHQLLDLSEKVALVTGGAVGIGRGIVERLAEAGAEVMLVDINPRSALATADDLKKRGLKVSSMHADISDIKEVTRVVQATVDALGGLDILVNNAGIFPFSPALETGEALWDKVLDINLKGSFFMAQAAARHMKASGTGGRIINIASIDAFHPSGSLAHYDASKGGMVMLTKSLAFELGRFGILVNGIAPGSIQTPGATEAITTMTKASGMTEEQMKNFNSSFNARIPLGRAGTPDDIASVALFLASPMANYITGETIIVDGGYLLS